MIAQPNPAGDAIYRELQIKIVASANEVRKFLTGNFAEIRILVEKHDLVFGVWADRSEPDGVGMLTIKGDALMREVMASQTTVHVRMVGIPCIEHAQAVALRQVAGEPDRLN